MKIRTMPAEVCGRIDAIPSKSAAHRSIICAALAQGVTKIHIDVPSNDIAATCMAVRALGATVEGDGDYTIKGISGKTGKPEINCFESGSTLRFMMPVAMAVSDNARFLGSGRLPKRPIEPLVSQMKAHGCKFLAETLPFEVRGRLRGGKFEFPGSVSSQFISGILLAAPMMEEGAAISLTSPLESSGYVDMTTYAMHLFGVEAERLEGGWRVRPGQSYVSPGELKIEGDWSNAAFWLCAGALGADITVKGLSFMSTQGDKAVIDILGRFGACVNIGAAGDISVKKSMLRGIELDVSEVPDLVPALAIVAASAKGPTRFKNAARLRIKESDRITCVRKLIESIGGRAEETADELIVCGGGFSGGCADGFGDHRIVMASAIAGMFAPVDIVGAEAVEKSYPTFFEDYIAVGGKADVI